MTEEAVVLSHVVVVDNLFTPDVGTAEVDEVSLCVCCWMVVSIGVVAMISLRDQCGGVFRLKEGNK